MDRRRMMMGNGILQIYQPGWKASEKATIADGKKWVHFQNDYLEVGAINEADEGKAVVLETDFTKYKKLVISAKRDSIAGSIDSGYVCVGWSKDKNFYYSNVEYKDAESYLQTFEFDISGVTGNTYIHLRNWTSGTLDLYVYDIHLE
jgi:hypothetical protein